MKPIDLLRELIYPLTDVTVAFAMIFFWFLFGLGKFAGLFGIALLALTVPAYLRFLLYLLEERANSRSARVPEITMFNPADNMWTLTPLILVAILMWTVQLQESPDWATVAALLGIATLFITPASVAILAVTHSPAQSLNPVALTRMIRACGGTYFVVPMVLVAVSVAFTLLVSTGTPSFFGDLGTSYQVILMFSLTGAVLRIKDIAVQVDIPPTQERSINDVANDLEKERQRVATHAYGFVSRGNRDGGLAHIRQWIKEEADIGDACQWFFSAMMTWESKDAALFFAQDYFAHLLSQQHDQEALKLISRCLHEDARWKPFERDREAARQLASKYQRDDLLDGLKP